MLFYQKSLLCLFTFVCFSVVFYMINQSSDLISRYNKPVNENEIKILWGKSLHTFSMNLNNMTPVESQYNSSDYYNVWCIFTKVLTNTPLKYKFKTFISSLLLHSNSRLRLHLISDDASLPVADSLLRDVLNNTRKGLDIKYYNVHDCATEIQDIVSAMKPHFSSQPGTYYSDSLFYLSLGLHRIAKDQKRAVLFDADTKLQADVAEIFKEFDKFGSEALFGLAPELTPVYRHVLYSYRSQNPNTPFGSASPNGVPGLNSGVMLLDFDRMRKSEQYHSLLRPEAVDKLTTKFDFKGHLGDQDFYTLLSMEHKPLVHVLPCGWNRQLCTWWRDHGYKEVFDSYHRCEEPIRAYHGNCNTQIPVA